MAVLYARALRWSSYFGIFFLFLAKILIYNPISEKWAVDRSAALGNPGERITSSW
jgi:hypothetical protein